MDGSYKISGKTSDGKDVMKILFDSSTMKIQSKNKFSSEFLEKDWHLCYMTIHKDDCIEILKIQRDEKKQSLVTVMPSDNLSQILQLQSHEYGLNELEYRAIGIMTLRPCDGSGYDIVHLIKATLFVKDPRPSQQCPSGSFLSSFNGQKFKLD